MFANTLYIATVCLSLLAEVTAHEGHEATDLHADKIKPEGKSWLEWHMDHEHGMSADAQAAFTLHDTRGLNSWNSRDILRMYGLSRKEVVGTGDGMGEHDSSEAISEEDKQHVVNTVLELIDRDGNQEISIEEWMNFIHAGGELPDFGYGPGHEFDFEEEYERHHWLEFHAENDPDVLIQHPEDIEHELLHHLHEIEHEESKGQVYNKRFPLRMEKVPSKFKISK